MHPVRDQQIALAPPADFAVLGVRFESRRIGKLKLMRQNDIVRAKILIAKAVGSIEMLINAEERPPRRHDRYGVGEIDSARHRQGICRLRQ